MTTTQPPTSTPIKDPLVNACILRANELSEKARRMQNLLHHGPSFNVVKFSNQYVELIQDIEKWMRELKQPAIAKCHFMTLKEGSPLKEALDQAASTLKAKHQMLLRQISDLTHAGEIGFSLLNAPSPEVLKFFKQQATKHLGWIVTAAMVSIAVMTQSSLGEQLGAAFTKAPQHVGTFFTSLFESPFCKRIISSSAMHETGKWCACLSPIYPTYRYMKEPVDRFFKNTILALDQTIAAASRSPLKTLIIAWGIYYVGLKALGIECSFAESLATPFHARLALTFGSAAATVNAVPTFKRWMDQWKFGTPSHLLHPYTPPLQRNAATQASQPYNAALRSSITGYRPPPLQLTAGRSGPLIEEIE